MVAALLMKPLFVLLAAEGHTPPPLVDFDLTILVQFVIFLVLMAVLTKFVFRPFLEIQKERDANIDGARQKATVLDTEAGDKFEAYDEKMAKARKESAAVRAEMRKEGEAKAGKILAEARTESEAEIESARAKIEKTAEAARDDLKARADELAGNIAAKLLGREV